MSVLVGNTSTVPAAEAVSVEIDIAKPAVNEVPTEGADAGAVDTKADTAAAPNDFNTNSPGLIEAVVPDATAKVRLPVLGNPVRITTSPLVTIDYRPEFLIRFFLSRSIF